MKPIGVEVVSKVLTSYMDCGHFISKGKGGASNIRWDERNAHLQCKSCNAFKQGNAQAYEEFMKAKYGTRIITLLSIKNRTVHRYMVVELWALAQFYKDKFEEQIDRWKEDQLGKAKPKGLTTEETSTAGAKEPPKAKGIKTEDELREAVREELFKPKE